MVGENHPKMSKVLATSETNIHLVMLFRGGNFATQCQESLCTLQVLEVTMVWASLRSGVMCLSTFTSLEFQFLSRNPPLEKRE